MKSGAWLKLLWAHVSKDETRYHLNGAYADEDGTMVATDGHRLIAINCGGEKVASFEVMALHGLHKGHIVGKDGLRIAGKYPAWQNLIPKINGEVSDHYRKLEWDSVPSLLKGIKIVNKNKPRFYIDSKGVTSYRHEGTLVCVDAGYLSVYYDMLEDGAEMWVKDNLSPVVIKCDVATAVLMPMRM